MDKTWILRKTFIFDYAHKLVLPYQSPCTNIHGHTGKFIVSLKTDKLNEQGMIIDYSHLKEIMKEFIDNIDHSFVMSNLNTNECVQIVNNKIYNLDLPQSSSEYLAYHIYNIIKQHSMLKNFDVQVEFFETGNNSACYGDW